MSQAALKRFNKRLGRLEQAIGVIIDKMELTKELGSWWRVGLVNPYDYANDDFDKKIIQLLLNNRVMTSTEMAESMGDRKQRHRIGKRLKRMEAESKSLGLQWLRYDGRNVQGHFRAYWLEEGMVDPKLLSSHES